MNVLRMIKLFGWEKKMFKRVTDKREAELVWIWKREIFELLANTVKYVRTPPDNLGYSQASSQQRNSRRNNGCNLYNIVSI